MGTTGAVSVPGGHLRWETEGDGLPVALLHAAVTDRHMWDPVVKVLVEAGTQPIWYDLRSFGESPTEDVEFSPRADLVAVLDAVGVTEAVVVGNSRGGLIALDAALEYPERISGLVHIGAFISGFDRDVTPAEAALFEAMAAAHGTGDAVAEATIDVQLWLDGPTAPEGRVGADTRATFLLMDVPICSPDRIEGRPLPLEPPANGRLEELGIPVLAIVGEFDLVAAHAAAERIESGVPGARRVHVPGAGHLLPLETPELTARLIADFSRDIGRR